MSHCYALGDMLGHTHIQHGHIQAHQTGTGDTQTDIQSTHIHNMKLDTTWTHTKSN